MIVSRCVCNLYFILIFHEQKKNYFIFHNKTRKMFTLIDLGKVKIYIKVQTVVESIQMYVLDDIFSYASTQSFCFHHQVTQKNVKHKSLNETTFLRKIIFFSAYSNTFVPHNIFFHAFILF